MAFVAFALAHSPCGDHVIEARLGEGRLLGWCVACAEAKIFGPPGARAPGKGHDPPSSLRRKTGHQRRSCEGQRRITLYGAGYTGGRDAMDRDTTTQPEAGTGDFLDQAPKVTDALKRGVSVSVTTWSGRKILGLVSDRDAAGLLLDLRGDENDAGGYVFLPWSSVEQVDIPEVAHRQVKFLNS